MANGDNLGPVFAPWYGTYAPNSYVPGASDYEIMANLWGHMNALFQKVEDIQAEENAYVDQRLAEMQEKLDGFQANVDDAIAEVNKDFDDFTDLVNANLTLFQSQINGFETELSNAVIGVNARTDAAIQQNNEYILQVIAEQGTRVYVTNYFTGQRVTAQEMFDYLARFHLGDAIDYNTLRDRNISYDALAALSMTYTQLVTSGGSLITS